MPYEYEIPAVNGKPLVEIPKELKDKVIDYKVLRDKIIIKASDLVDQLLYDTRVKVKDELGRLIKSIIEYSFPPTASAIVTKDEDYVYAYKPANNWKGYILIDKGEVGVEDAKVIQSAVNTIGEGKIFIKKGTYKITQKISCPGGILFEGEPGTIIDCSSITGTAFAFNENSDGKVCENKLTGFRNLKFVGDVDNTNLAYFENITQRIIIEKVYVVWFKNVIEFAGACYAATIRDVTGSTIKGTAVKLKQFDSEVYKPDSVLIDNLRLANGTSWYEGYKDSVGVDTIEAPAANEIKITNCRFEGFGVGIKESSAGTNIKGNFISAYDLGIYVKGFMPRIQDNNIGILNASGKCIQLDKGATGKIDIVGNVISVSRNDSIGIELSGEYVIIDSNYFYIIGDGAKGISGSMRGTITGNEFIGNESLVSDGISVTLISGSIIGNHALYLDKFIELHSGSYAVVEGNSYVAGYVNTPYTIPDTSYCDQYLYTTLPDTSNTNISELFKNRPIHYYDGTNYYIAVWDGSTWRKVQLS